MAMTWTPERAGNWLFHCHVMTHVSPSLYVDGTSKPASEHDHHSAGMTGMVLGITVTSRDGSPSAKADLKVRPTSPEHLESRKAAIADERNGAPAPDRSHVGRSFSSANDSEPRKLTLVMRSDPNRFGDATSVRLHASGRRLATHQRTGVGAGPALVLTRGEPVEITLVNELPEPTAIHWHGMELESYYDGVHGFGGIGSADDAADSARRVICRAVHASAHRHFHLSHASPRPAAADLRLVWGDARPRSRSRPSTLRPIMCSCSAAVVRTGRCPSRAQRRALADRSFGGSEPSPSGARDQHHSRTTSSRCRCSSAESPATWRPLTKDGAPVPTDRAQPRPARQIIGVGETYDFEVDAPAGVRLSGSTCASPGGKWQAQGRVIVK